MTAPTLRHAALAADAERFVGRDAELAAAASLLDDSPSRVLYLHGPGGIGKSAMLRAIGRLGTAAGFTVVTADPRGLAADFDRQVHLVLDELQPETLLLVDEVDVLGSALPAMRERLLDQLPATARLVLAGRAEPDRSWRADGLDAIFVDVTIAPLDDDEAAALLAAHGVDARRRSPIVSWAEGSPLALTVAATTPSSDGTPASPSAEALEARLTSWLAGTAMLDVPPEVLAVAAIAPTIDARLLAAALPARPTRQAMGQLAALPVVERVGGRLVLHAVLASAIRTRMAATAPEQLLTLRRRIVEELTTRARLGDIGALVELSQFIEDPTLRQAVSNRPSPTLRPSVPAAGELASFARAEGFDLGPDWGEIQAWVDSGRPSTLCVRRRDSSIVLYGAFASVAAASHLGPVLESLHLAAGATDADASRSFVGVVLFATATEHERAEAARLGTGAMMHQHGVADMQTVLIHYPPPDRRPREALAAIAADLPDDLPRPVALSDFRPFGAVGFIERIVLGELGVTPPAGDAASLLADDDDPERQAQLRVVLDEVFGPTPDDQRLRHVIELTHLHPRRGERECLDALHVSRSTWFRLLRKARERVLAGSASTPPPRVTERAE